MAANDVQLFDNNVLILNAAEDGVIALGLINHYYWYEQVAEEGLEAVPARLKFLPDGDPGSLVNVAGVGVLAASDRQDEAARFVEYLLGDDAQTYFAQDTKEYPLDRGHTDGRGPATARPACRHPRSTCPTWTPWRTTLQMIEEAGLT